MAEQFVEVPLSGPTEFQQLFIAFDKDKSSFESSSDDHRRNLVTFKLCCQPCLTNCIVRQLDTPVPLIETTDLPLIETCIVVSLDDDEEAREILDSQLQGWPVPTVGRRLLIDLAMRKAWEMVKCMPPHYNSVHLQFRLTACHVTVIYEEEEEIVWTVPADESSIESLEKKKINDCGTDCSICLEEMLRGAEGLYMPCRHVFHEDCIKKWLRTSHYCPVCRYQMPERVDI
ncbi:hypothetical protein CASFOL_012771 [Castilleja foliolosa]|uniref:RING-type E3 ubiquitin transferase n=1 Tax=Castilleja foliolosa TaxID=1961234 RepID=A0ABD3DJW3_9LAMI